MIFYEPKVVKPETYRNILTWNCWIRTLLDPKKQALQALLQHARQMRW